MKKTAQPLNYGELAGYGNTGFSPYQEDPRLLAGGYEPPNQSRLPNWAIPAAIAAGGLGAYGLLRGGIKGLGRMAKAPGKWMAEARTVPKWNFEAEAMGRLEPHFQSALHKGQPVGHGFGPGIEDILQKTSSLDLVQLLNRFARHG